MGIKGVLPEFQEFLLTRKLAQEKHVLFLAIWVSKFLSFSNRKGHQDLGLTVAEFQKSLEAKEDIKNWQLRQAAEAVRLYLNHFKGNEVLSAVHGIPERKAILSGRPKLLFCALVFLFREVLGQELGDISGMVWAKRGKKLPVELWIEEVKAIFQHLSGTSLLMAQLLYGSGLRIMEITRLRVLDIDFEGNLLVC